MQEDLQAAQQRLAEATVEGSVAGGAVKVTVNGAGEHTGVTISPDVVGDPAELADYLEELGDYVVAAYRDARARADELATETLGPLAGGLPGLPGADPGASPGQIGF
jgi:DNA-binding protein YbaB